MFLMENGYKNTPKPPKIRQSIEKTLVQHAKNRVKSLVFSIAIEKSVRSGKYPQKAGISRGAQYRPVNPVLSLV